MSTDARVLGYAQALYGVAKAEDALDTVNDELFRIARTIDNEARLRDALVDPNLPATHRGEMIAELLGPRAHPVTTNLVRFVVESGRARELGSIIASMVQLAADEAKRAVAEVRTAVPLDGEQRAKLEQALREATGKDIALKVTVDPSVVGGFVARVGDLVFDATVRRKLELAKEHFGRK